MEFKRYQHIERIGTTATNGIVDGMCYVFPKIDGTNSQLWFENGIQAGSRNRQLSLDNDNAGFYNWASHQDMFMGFFAKYPHVRLYGEWLVPHTLRTYSKTAWNNFYVFDVMDRDSYLHYDTYKIMLDEFEIEYIPPICKIKDPTYERLITQLEKNGYLIEDGKGTGEGIVIKNYYYKNKFGNVVWAKIVKNEFKAKHSKVDVTEVKENKIIEEEIVNKYVTKALIEKELSKIELESGWSSKLIPRLLNTVYYCLITEESWNIVKEFKNPTIDYKRIVFFTTRHIKELMPHLF
jgi:RNA ligase